jgi:preprotein translocase subunit SecF
MLPRTRTGRRAVWLALVAVASWVVVPLTTITLRDAVPITDTWVMPAIVALLTDVAAVLGLLALFRYEERSIVVIALTVLTAPVGAFFTVMLVSEGIPGV